MISFGLNVRLRKPFNELLPLLWVLLLYQISQISCASIKNYSLESVNFSVIQTETSAPKNLSELIEFSSLNLPVEVENITIVQKETQEGTPNVVTFKLKTHLAVENNSKNKANNQKTTVENDTIVPKESESSLDGIEYLDEGEYWKWNLNRREREMNDFIEQGILGDKPVDTSDSSEERSSEHSGIFSDSEESQENQISNEVRRSNYARGRQFLFHPYLPYGKDIPPDEKISFHDILPVKMVKFVKSMVEEAPWEQMFIKMVRMIVDQFVDKIIEKMFADKHDDGFRRRSFDLFQPAFVLPNFKTPVFRLKRSVSTKTSPEQDEDIFSFLPPKKTEQDIDSEDKKDEDNRSWLDRLLDYVFPNTKSSEYDDEYFSRLKKRDTTNTQLLKRLIAFFVSTFEKSSGILSDAKDVLRYKMLKDFLPFLFQKRYVSKNNSSVSSNYVDEMKMSHRQFSNIERNDDIDYFSNALSRSKRSATRSRHIRVEENRLWQSDRHRSHNHRSHDVCSLRKACNAGRLLARLPSVQEITLQLQSDGNEPHWNALIWGMKKKRCSRIFCKRQRSPKGARFSWNSDESRKPSKKDEVVTEPPTTELEETYNNLDV